MITEAGSRFPEGLQDSAVLERSMRFLQQFFVEVVEGLIGGCPRQSGAAFRFLKFGIDILLSVPRSLARTTEKGLTAVETVALQNNRPASKSGV